MPTGIAVVYIITVMTLGALLSPQAPNQNSSSQERVAGPYDVRSPLELDKNLAEIREFLWKNWVERRPARLKATFYSVEGDPAHYTCVIGKDQKRWYILVRIEQLRHSLLREDEERPRVRKWETKYYDAERIDIRSSAVISA